jgi:hypothetical protein
MKKIAFIASVLVLATLSVMAQTQTPRTNARQKAQRARIAEGRADGEVTKGEAVALNKQQRHIRRSERRAKADGEVTPQEKAKLQRKQNRASRNIRRAKTNDIDKKD